MTSQDDVFFLNGSICLEPAKWTFFKPHIKSLCSLVLSSLPIISSQKWASCLQFLICSNLKRFYKFLGNLWASDISSLNYITIIISRWLGKKKLMVVEGLSRDDWGRQTWVQQCVTSSWPSLSLWPSLHNGNNNTPSSTILWMALYSAWHILCAQEMLACVVVLIIYFIYLYYFWKFG